MKIVFKKLIIEHFKNHEKLEVNFSDVTQISGRNGIGKSSIADAITYLLEGTDSMGNSKFNPLPITNQEAELKVELLLSVTRPESDPAELLLAKHLVKGKAKYFVNEVPEPAKRFDEVVAAMFDKNLFLSIFNPTYFSSQPMKDQRQQLLKYVPMPFESEVLEKLTKHQQEALAEGLKKHKIEDLAKVHKPKLDKLKREIDLMSGKITAYKEQLAQDEPEEDISAIILEVRELEKEIQEAKAAANALAAETNKKDNMAYDLKRLKVDMEKLKAKVEQYQAEPIIDECNTCGQKLTEQALEKVKSNKQQILKDQFEKGQALAAEYRAIFTEWKALPEPERGPDISDKQQRVYDLKKVLDASENRGVLQQLLEKAEKEKAAIKKDMNISQDILEAVTAFEAMRSSLMVEKVGSLFTRLTVKLLEKFQNGNTKEVFEVEYDGKPYAKLSTAERIKAGLEVIDALITQSGISCPVFIDNAESIITFKKPKAQLITATVKNSALIIKGADAE